MKADIIVGIPSYNEANTISFVVSQIDKGLVKYFPKKKCLIVNIDNHSPDNTEGAFLNTETKTHKIYLSTPKGIKGKGRNLHNLFKLAVKLNAEAIMVADADLESITPEWVKKFVSPILEKKSDFIFPYYARHPYDGTITNQICYPLTYGLLGTDIRQPIGGDFSFNQKVAKHWMKKKWDEPIKNYGVDIFMTLNAVLGGFKISHADLGAKIHKPSAPKLNLMFTQVVSTIFKILLSNKKHWRKKMKAPKKNSRPSHAKRDSRNIPPAPPGIDRQAIKKTSAAMFEENKKILKKYLKEEIYQELEKMYERKNIHIGSGLWVEIVYEILEQFNKTKFNPALVEALKPLYFARVLSFMRETEKLSAVKTEMLIQKQAKIFFKKRNYFYER